MNIYRLGGIIALLWGISWLGCRQEQTSMEEQQPNVSGSEPSQEVSTMLAPIHWLGHASVKITGEKVIYIDPWQLKKGEPADLILITHGHYDHCSPEDVAKIQKSGTVIVATSDCKNKLSGDVRTIAPGDQLDVNGIQIEAVPAYNIGTSFHPKANGWVGYIVTVNGARVYHAGDTDRIPEMDDINTDVALLPVGGTYTMNAQQAAEAAIAIGPKVAVPMHYARIVGSEDDAKRFQELCKGKVEVVILKPE